MPYDIVGVLSWVEWVSDCILMSYDIVGVLSWVDWVNDCILMSYDIVGVLSWVDWVSDCILMPYDIVGVLSWVDWVNDCMLMSYEQFFSYHHGLEQFTFQWDDSMVLVWTRPAMLGSIFIVLAHWNIILILSQPVFDLIS